ncbi:MAG TPA: SH3 domain-containing protein [Polyangiaceae bacterium]|nr:SH3 domain-containing protein [Polyangiaceae bacterium]
MTRFFRWAFFASLLLAIGACGGEDDGDGRPASSGGSGATGGVATGGAAGTGAGGVGGADAGGAPGGASGAGTGGAASGGTAGSGGAGPDPCPRVKVEVSAGSTLNVRPTPSTAQAPIGALSAGEIVQVLAQVQGEAVNGSTLWFQIATPVLSGYISAEFASCTQEVPPPPPAAY